MIWWFFWSLLNSPTQKNKKHLGETLLQIKRNAFFLFLTPPTKLQPLKEFTLLLLNSLYVSHKISCTVLCDRLLHFAAGVIISDFHKMRERQQKRERVRRCVHVACVYDEPSGQQFCYLSWDNIHRSSAWQMFLFKLQFHIPHSLLNVYSKYLDMNL